jgi:hypothetical protein
MKPSVDLPPTDLVTALRSTPFCRRALRLSGLDRPYAPEPALRDHVPWPLIQAIARLATGTVHRVDCAGHDGEMWRVSWSRTGRRARWIGVLDPRTRLFVTTASGTDALEGFALSAIGFAWALPTCGFDGEWASLLGTLAVEGMAALRLSPIREIARLVLDALLEDRFGGGEPDESCAEPRPWRLLVVRDAGELPALALPAPRALEHALEIAPSPRGVASILSDFGRFSACAEQWQRSRRRAPHAWYCGEETEIAVRALARGLHVVLEGPPGTGKTCCARDIIAGYHGVDVGVPIMSVRLETIGKPEELIGHLTPDGEWVDGPIRKAMHARDGDGCAIHLSSSEPLTYAMLHLLRAVLKMDPACAPLVPGAPAGVAGPRFRVVLEVTSDERPGAYGSLTDAGGAISLRFERPTGPRLAAILACLESRVPRAMRDYAVWVVDDMARAVEHGMLPRVLSLGEVRAWLALALELLSDGFEGDWLGAMETAATRTWVAAFPGGADWWERSARYYGDAVARERTLMCASRPPDSSPIEASRAGEPIGLRSWQRFPQVRTMVDRLTRAIEPTRRLVLLPSDRFELDGAFGVCPVGDPDRHAFCYVGLQPAVGGTAVDAFAVVVATAAHERAHTRWSSVAPRPSLAAAAGGTAGTACYEQCWNILEDMRIERLLDRFAPPYLAPYRRRDAGVLALRDECEPSAEPAQRLLEIVHNVVWEVLLCGEAAWERAMALGERVGLPAPLLSRALMLLRSAGEAGEDEDVVPALAGELARLVDELGGGSSCAAPATASA